MTNPALAPAHWGQSAVRNRYELPWRAELAVARSEGSLSVVSVYFANRLDMLADMLSELTQTGQELSF